MTFEVSEVWEPAFTRGGQGTIEVGLWLLLLHCYTVMIMIKYWLYMS